MGDDMSNISEIFDIWVMTCRRFQKFSTYVRRSVPATSHSQTCRRQFSVGAEVGCSGRELLYFAVFFLKFCATGIAL